MLELQTESLLLSNGKTIVISENDWDMSRKLNRLTEEAKLAVNGGTSSVDYFRKNYYPILAAAASGEVPDAFEAAGLPADDLDAWYMLVWKLNSDWFREEYRETFNSELVIFRDGSELQVWEAANRPSFMLRLAFLENDPILDPSPDIDIQLFRQVFYPKMAACVRGEVPSAAIVRKWPTAEINKWYEAAKRMNPDWFAVLEEMSAEAQAALAEQEKQVKKKA